MAHTGQKFTFQPIGTFHFLVALRQLTICFFQFMGELCFQRAKVFTGTAPFRNITNNCRYMIALGRRDRAKTHFYWKFCAVFALRH